jgi:hypothetical protein
VLREELKGRHNVKHIGIARGTAEDLTPIMDRIRGQWRDEREAA